MNSEEGWVPFFFSASSTKHHQGDGSTSSLGPVSMGTDQRALCSAGLVVDVEAAVLHKLDLSPSRVEEADSGRKLQDDRGGNRSTASVLAQPMVSIVQQHTLAALGALALSG